MNSNCLANLVLQKNFKSVRVLDNNAYILMFEASESQSHKAPEKYIISSTLQNHMIRIWENNVCWPKIRTMDQKPVINVLDSFDLSSPVRPRSCSPVGTLYSAELNPEIRPVLDFEDWTII